MDEDIITLRLEGLGYKAIAKKLGITRDRARDVCRRNGLGGVLATTRAQEEIQKVCAYCGKPFTTTSKTRKYCSEDCSKSANMERAKKAAQIKAQAKIPPEPIECPVCGTMFVPRNKLQKRCSKRCGSIFHDRMRSSNNTPRHGYCACCGKEIDTRNGRKFCSRACGKAYRGIGRKYKLPKVDLIRGITYNLHA